MVAEKRSRSKPLIRTTTMIPPVTGVWSAGNGGPVKRQQNHGNTQARLKQLSELYMSGVLTDEEYAAAKQRLLGS